MISKNRNMSKGAIPVEAIIGGILLILAILFTYVFINWGQSPLESLVNFIKSLFGGEEAATNVLVEAIKCSYYRCKHGCVSRIDNIDINGQNCRAVYCEPFRDANNKVCDDNAKGNPVKTGLIEEPITISKAAVWFVDCLLSREDYTRAPGGDLKLVIVDKDDVEEEKGETTCRGVHPYGAAYRELIVEATENYYIWSWNAPGAMGKKDTSVTSESPSPCADGQKFCPECLTGKISDYGEDVGGDACIHATRDCGYECNSACNPECENDAICKTALNDPNAVCNLDTCSCELSPPEYYCCYSGWGYSYVDCLTNIGCESLDFGTFTPPGTTSPIPCDFQSPNCPEYTP